MFSLFISLSDVGDIIKQAIRSFLGGLAALIYNFISVEFDVFMKISRTEILDSTIVKQIYARVGLILGIFMIFKLSFSLIQSLIDPSKISDSNKGYVAILRRLIISVVLLGTTPWIFREARSLQDIIVGDEEHTNIIYKLVVASDTYGTASSFGKRLSTDLFFSFFRESYEGSTNLGSYFTNNEIGYLKLEVDNINSLRERIANDPESDFHDVLGYLSSTDGSSRYIVEWDGLFSLVTGIIVVYILLTYCIQAATRVIQLAFLELIAPIPIFSYITDPEGTFKAWLKQCLTTYIDLFIRLAIIYFIVSLCNRVVSIYEGLESSDLNIWIKVFLILGLLMFGKKVPDLIKELFPNIGVGAANLSMGIKKPKDMISSIPLLGNAVGRVGGKAAALGKKGATALGKGISSLPKKGVNELKKRANGRLNTLKSEFNGKHLNKVGEKAFSGKFAESYKEKQSAKAAVEQAQIAAKSATTAEEKAIAERNLIDAQKRLATAEKRHEINRTMYVSQAEREDRMNAYKVRHGLSSTTSNGSSSGQQTSNSSQQTSDDSRQASGSSRSQLTEEQRQNIYNGTSETRPLHFAGEERRTSERPSNSSDGVMPQSDAEDTSSKNKDTREYQNWDDVGE